MSTVDASLLEDHGRPGLMIWLTAVCVAVFGLWASVAWVDEIVRGQGEIVSSSRPQIIQNLEGGILAELYVAEGDTVEPGDVLGRLYGTQYKTETEDLTDQIGALEIRRLRLEAEMTGAKSFTVPEALATRLPAMLASEQALIAARMGDFESRRDGALQVLKQAQKERDILEEMLKKEIAPLIEVTRARKAAEDAEIRANEVTTQIELDRAKEHSEIVAKLSSLRQGQKIATDKLDRTMLVAPMKGVVNKLSVTTIGGVVRPGEEIMQIIPAGEELFIEARVAPKDVANVKPGQEAAIKLSAYDYTIYGALKGVVETVSADTFKDERKPDGDAHYKVTLKLDRSALTERQKSIDLRPGMQATVELFTGQKTVLQYLLKPLMKSREAFREP